MALRRSAAQAGDDIWVTGVLGGPHVALRLMQGHVPPGCNNTAALLAQVRTSLEQPLPPVAFSQGLPGIAHAALDISDGLLQDLGHILKASGCGAQLFSITCPSIRPWPDCRRRGKKRLRWAAAMSISYVLRPL